MEDNIQYPRPFRIPVNAEDVGSVMETNHLLSSAANAERLLESLAEMEEGNLLSLEDLFAEFPLASEFLLLEQEEEE